MREIPQDDTCGVTKDQFFTLHSLGLLGAVRLPPLLSLLHLFHPLLLPLQKTPCIALHSSIWSNSICFFPIHRMFFDDQDDAAPAADTTPAAGEAAPAEGEAPAAEAPAEGAM